MWLDLNEVKNKRVKVAVNGCETTFGFRSRKAELLTESYLTIYHLMLKNVRILTISKCLAFVVK